MAGASPDVATASFFLHQLLLMLPPIPCLLPLAQVHVPRARDRIDPKKVHAGVATRPPRRLQSAPRISGPPRLFPCRSRRQRPASAALTRAHTAAGHALKRSSIRVWALLRR